MTVVGHFSMNFSRISLNISLTAVKGNQNMISDRNLGSP
jgi:hypothetical protein